MQKNIHPKYGKTKIIANNGIEFEVNSCLFMLEGGQYHLAADPFTHPAWTRLNTGGKLSGDNARMKRFTGIDKI